MAEVTAFRNNATHFPVYGVPWAVVYPFLDADGDLITGATTPDAEVSKNGDTFADCTNESVEIATASGVYYLLLTGTEMTADIVTVIAKNATAGGKTTVLTFYPRKLVALRAATAAGGAAGSITLDASASAVDDFYNGCLVVGVLDSLTEARIITDYTGSSKVAAVTPNWNTTPDSDDTFTIYLTGSPQITQANVTHINSTAQTARDIGANVLLSPGTGTGQLDITSGVTKANATQFAGQTITAGAGVTMPATVASATNITAGTITTVTNLTNAPTSGDLTATMKTSVTTAATAATPIAASVTGAVGSVASGGITTASFAAGAINAAALGADAITAAKIADGAIDAATFAAGAINAAAIAVDAITDAKVASDVTIASVTGAVGSVTGAVGSVAAGGITAASFAANAINAAKLDPDVATELQAGLATASSLSTAQTSLTDIQARIPTALVGGRIVADVTAISGDSAAADALENAFDGTAGPVPAMGIIDRGTAQSATATTLVLRAAAAFADDEIIGATIVITGGSAGIGQVRAITDYVSSTDTATVATWTTTPTGTITYEIYGTPVGADLAPLQSDLTTLVARVPAPITGALVAGSNSATAHTTDLTEATTDHFKDAYLTYTSGTLSRQTKKITAYNGTTKVLTTNAFTGTATVADTFVIVNGR